MNLIKKKKRQKILLTLLVLVLLGTTGSIVRSRWIEHAEHQAIASQISWKLFATPGPGRSPLPEADCEYLDFESIRSKNPDITAWLTLDGTGIDFPVVQSSDNLFYIDHDAEGKSNSKGALFLDYRCNFDFSDFNNIIYGHNLNARHMFGTLMNYKDKNYFDKHRTGRLYTPCTNYSLDVFAVLIIPHKSKLYRYAFISKNDKADFFVEIQQAALYWDTLRLEDGETLLMLSTCSYEFKNARTVVFARCKPI